MSEQGSSHPASPRLTVEVDTPLILLWWRGHQHRYPNLAKLARRYLCVPATSAPSERVFSNAGLTISNASSRLLAENACDSIMLRDAWPVVDAWDKAQERAEARNVRPRNDV